MEDNITGIKIFSSTNHNRLEDQVNNFLNKSKGRSSIVKRDIRIFGNTSPIFQISLCTTKECIEPLEMVKIFTNILNKDSKLKVENDARDFISSQKNVVDVLFNVYMNKHEIFNSIAVFYKI